MVGGADGAAGDRRSVVSHPGDAGLTVSPGRAAALDTLRRTARGQRLDLAFESAVRSLEARERSFAHELAFGVVRLQSRLDALLAPHVHQGLDTLDRRLRPLLRSGLYQILYMDVPDYAAVSQTVDQARSVGLGRASGLVNAVLRAAARAGDDPSVHPHPDVDPAGFLSSWGSHPRWLVERWLRRWPFPDVRRLVELNNRRPALHVVPLDGDLEAAAARLSNAGAEVRVLTLPGSLEVVGISPARALEEVEGFVQDPAASLVCRYAAPEPGSRVADLCAAPGGKALYLARRARYVVAADPSRSRLRLLAENVRRSGLAIGVVQARAEAPPVQRVETVLVDAPCTGTGTLRRHPDARWRLGSDAPRRLSEVQARILRGAAVVVPPRGVLVYATCTLEPEENDAVVGAFLREHPEFRVEPPDDERLEIEESGCLEVVPQRTGWDGAFAARLRRLA
ncbi:MAG: transcription antitermination factor NusB [Gemmatimonadota bacterium]